jgi:NADH-quinone oxidoreductase subunit H
MMVLRWTLPRFRFDQLMKLAWRALIPVTLAMLLITGLVIFIRPIDAQPQHWYWVLTVANVAVVLALLVLGPRVPAGPPVNRRVGLAGSRFSPAQG